MAVTTLNVNVALNFSSNAAGVLGQMNNQMGAMHQQVRSLQGALQALGAYKAFETLVEGIKMATFEAGKLVDAILRIKGMGFNPNEMADLRQNAIGNTNIPGVTPAESINATRHLAALLPSHEDAIGATEKYLQIKKLWGFESGQSGPQLEKTMDDLIQIIELRHKDPADFARSLPGELEQALRANVGLGFNEKSSPQQMLLYARQGGLTVQNEDPSLFWGRDMVLAQQLNASRMGTAINSLMTKMVGSDLSGQAAADLMAMGMVKKVEPTLDTLGRPRHNLYHVAPSSIANSELLVGDHPDYMKWFDIILEKTMKTFNLSKKDAMLKMGEVLGRQNIERLFLTEEFEKARLKAKENTISQVEGVGNMESDRMKSFSESLKNFSAAWEHLEQSMAPALGPLTWGINALADAFQSMGRFLDTHPDFAVPLSEGLLLLTSGLGLLLAGASLSGLATLTGAMGLGGLAAIFTGAAWLTGLGEFVALVTALVLLFKGASTPEKMENKGKLEDQLSKEQSRFSRGGNFGPEQDPNATMPDAGDNSFKQWMRQHAPRFMLGPHDQELQDHERGVQPQSYNFIPPRGDQPQKQEVALYLDKRLLGKVVMNEIASGLGSAVSGGQNNLDMRRMPATVGSRSI